VDGLSNIPLQLSPGCPLTTPLQRISGSRPGVEDVYQLRHRHHLAQPLAEELQHRAEGHCRAGATQGAITSSSRIRVDSVESAISVKHEGSCV
jgi:hypothetical protein